MRRYQRSIAFFEENPRTALGLALFFSLGGVASVLGYLRAQTTFFQWALALFLWTVAGVAGVTGWRALQRP